MPIIVKKKTIWTRWLKCLIEMTCVWIRYSLSEKCWELFNGMCFGPIQSKWNINKSDCSWRTRCQTGINATYRWAKKSLITNHQAVSFLLWLIEWVFRQNTNKWILTGPFMGAIKGYGHPKVKWSPPPCYGWLPLSLWHHISQQMAVTLHFNKFSPWQGFISSIIHLFSNSFHIISCHSTHPWRQRDRGRIRWLFLFRPNNTSV